MIFVESSVSTRQPTVISKILRDWSNGSRPFSGEDANLGNFRPGPGTAARIVIPHSLKAWEPEVPVMIARAVMNADSWFLDATGNPAVITRLADDIEAALNALKASR